MKKIRKVSILILSAIMAFFCAGFAYCGDPYQEVYLAKPNTISFDAGTMTLSWGAVENAKEYEISISVFFEPEITHTTTQTTMTFDSNDFIGIQGTITFSVKALWHTVGNTTYVESPVVSTNWHRTMSALSRPENLVFDRATGRLSWETVEDAEYYIIDYNSRINGVPSEPTGSRKTENNYYDFGAEFDGVTPMYFAVTANTADPDIHNSSEATVSSFIQLSAPTNLAWSGTTLGYFTWDPVPNAVYYEVWHERWISFATSANRHDSTPVRVNANVDWLAQQFLVGTGSGTLHWVDFKIRAFAVGYLSSTVATLRINF